MRVDRRQYLLPHLIGRPALGRAEVVDRFLLVDEVDELLPHVLMRKAHGMASLMADHTVKFRFRRRHGE